MQHKLGNIDIWTDLVTQTDFLYVGAKTSGTRTPIVPSYQHASPYPQPQAAGSFTKHQAQPGTNPYPQV